MPIFVTRWMSLKMVPVEIDTKMPDGSISTIIVNPADGNSSFVKIIHHFSAGLQRSFNEAKGLVINDYQNNLEDTWIEGLKKKYPIKINEAVFQSLLK